MNTSAAVSSKKEWTLKRESELRCEVGEGASLTLRLTSGNAEVFGVEMALGKEYHFRDQNIAVFTWYGCSLESNGDGSIYVADTTPMVAYVNTHIQLEARRDVALANGELGPRVMVVGPTDNGKSTLARILTAYALRLDRSPIFVDIDVGQPMNSIPGALTAFPLEKTCLNVEDGFTNINPLVYYYGHTSPKDNPLLYCQMVSILAKNVQQRLEKDQDAKSSGIIVNTSGYIDGDGFDILLSSIKDFGIDVVLVMGHDKLYSKLRESLDADGSAGKSIVVNLPVSGGKVTRDATTRKRLRKNRIREYFYGKPLLNGPGTQFAPERRDLSVSSFRFLRCGGLQLSEGMRAYESTTGGQDVNKIIKITPTSDLVHSVVALIHAPESDPNNGRGEVTQDFINCNVAGFISVLQLEFDSDRMSILSPCPGALPTNNLLVGNVKWTE